jgi:hypothetical protein
MNLLTPRFGFMGVLLFDYFLEGLFGPAPPGFTACPSDPGAGRFGSALAPAPYDQGESKGDATSLDKAINLLFIKKKHF